MLSVHDIILIMQWGIFLNDTSLHKSQRHAYDKNTVRNDVKCRIMLLVGHWFTLLVTD